MTLLQVLPRATRFMGVGDSTHARGGADVTQLRVDQGDSVMPPQVQQGTGVLN